MSRLVNKTSAIGLLVLSSVLTLGGCGPSVGAAVYVPEPPPPVYRERIVAAPGTGYVWIGGHHQWEGGRYVWVSGRWERPPHAYARWEAGQWRHRRQGWYWTAGRWR
jgi:hypothetical protein